MTETQANELIRAIRQQTAVQTAIGSAIIRALLWSAEGGTHDDPEDIGSDYLSALTEATKRKSL